MKRYPSCSFTSGKVIEESQLSKVEQSIMKMYEKLMYSQQTQFYEVQNLVFNQIPKTFPNSIKNSYNYAIFLQKFTFYEMFTMLIFEYLYTPNLQKQTNQTSNQCQQKAMLAKVQKIKKLKSLIYADWFMEGNYYMKGLLIKGFNLLEEAKTKKYPIPIGQFLLSTDIILAFSQCWKQLINKICRENSLPIMQENQIDSSIFEMFACYFQVNFDIHWKQKGKRYWKEHFRCEGANSETVTLAIMVNPDNQISVSQRSIPITQSRASVKSLATNSSIANWNYVMLCLSCTQTNLHLSLKKVDESLQLDYPSKNQHHNPEKYKDKNLRYNSPTLKNNLIKDFAKLNNNQISHISEVDFSCGETEQIKILLQGDSKDEIIETTERKTPKYMNQYTFSLQKSHHPSVPQQKYNNQLNNIWHIINKTNSLIDDMRKYTQFLEEVEI